MTNIKKEFEKIVKQVVLARKKSGLSQHAVCKQAGISQAAWWEVEAGVNVPRLPTVSAVASVLGLRVAITCTKDPDKNGA